MPSVLFVLTSADTNLVGGQTGYYLPEAAHPYYTLAPHVSIDFASPKGPNPPVDQGSVEAFKDDESVKFLSDETVKSKLAKAKQLSTVNVKDYDAILYVGGHGPVLDLPNDPANIKFASEFYQSGKIVGAVCHGPAALLNAVDAEGKPIYSGKEFTGFSNAEEEAVQKVNAIPFLLETEFTKRGGKYTKAEQLWAPKVVIDGNLYTGQNPASAKPLGEAILKKLQK
ncbi:related to NonF protein, involved in nonactin biosynthesis [Armillaria ostoyae]|uniref:D-lactate dehydratase n=1 Tax=Armillaria ostoyae TaxID=47428 RepID=A0A284QZJ7_ARMOS|nr:related to NonF protein, involved in nonactin biosynthesis [Armillaria ostoyae]